MVREATLTSVEKASVGAACLCACVPGSHRLSLAVEPLPNCQSKRPIKRSGCATRVGHRPSEQPQGCVGGNRLAISGNACNNVGREHQQLVRDPIEERRGR